MQNKLVKRFRLVRQCTVQIENIGKRRSFEDAFETIPPYIAAQKRTLAVSCDFMNVILFVYLTIC